MSLYEDSRSSRQIESDEFLVKAKRCRENAKSGTVPHLGEGPNGEHRQECWINEAEIAEKNAEYCLNRLFNS